MLGPRSQRAFSLGVETALFYFFLGVNVVQSTGLDWYKRVSLGSLYGLTYSGLFFLFFVWVVLLMNLRQLFDVVDGMLAMVTLGIPVAFFFGVAIPKPELALNIYFHLGYAIVAVSLFAVLNFRIYQKLNRTQHDRTAQVFRTTCTHLDLPSVFALTIVFALVALVHFSFVTGIKMSEVETFVAGALAFEIITLQTALSVTHLHVQYPTNPSNK